MKTRKWNLRKDQKGRMKTEKSNLEAYFQENIVGPQTMKYIL